MSKTGQNVAKGAQTTEDLANITGTVAGGMQLADVGTKLYGKLTDSEKITPPTPEEQAITETQTNAQQAEAKANIAAEARKNVATQAVKATQDINTKVGAYKDSLGEQFTNDAEKLKAANPNLKLNLTNEQVQALNSLKESKNFTLPKNLKSNDNIPDLSKMNPKVAAQLKGKLASIGKETSNSLDPVQAQNLIKELNRSTYKQMADGTMQIDQQRIGVTQQIKDAALKAFAPENMKVKTVRPWSDIYAQYSVGRMAIDKIDNLVNLNPKATPDEINSQLQGILKLSNTPEGKILLQQSVNEYAKTSGIDLNEPIKAIQEIADKQTALDDANSEMTKAQKEAAKAVRDADISKIKQEEKEKTFGGRHPAVKEWTKYIAKRAVAGGLIYATLYPTIRAIKVRWHVKK